VTACSILGAAAPALAGGELSITVAGSAGTPVAGAVVVAEPAQAAPHPRTGLKAVMDQRDLQYVPDVLIVQTGTEVEFPNSDNVRHQVYSFSPAKTFHLSLYSGREHAAVVFDRKGLVTLGCNIHDSMLGYIYVTDSPWFGRTGPDGSLQLHDLAPGDYTVRLWHPLLNESGPYLQLPLHIDAGAAARTEFHLHQALRADPRSQGSDKKWADY
jgi:plastocyanin